MTSSQPPPTAKPDATAMPVQFSAPEVAAVILPPLSLPKRGPQCKLGSPKPFNSILKGLSTGMPWKKLPIDKDPAGHAERHYPGVVKLVARGAEDRSRERAGSASGKQRDDAHKLDLSVLHGDGANPVAHKGGTGLATAATNTRRERQ